MQYDSHGRFIRKFGGKGNEDDQFSTAHGVTVDYRHGHPSLIITSRGHNSFKRFSLDGKYISTIFLPGAYVCRPVIHGDHLYAGVCWSRLRYLDQTPNSGFVTILDKTIKWSLIPEAPSPLISKASCNSCYKPIAALCTVMMSVSIRMRIYMYANGMPIKLIQSNWSGFRIFSARIYLLFVYNHYTPDTL